MAGPLALIPAIAGIGAQAAGGEAARKTTLEGARSALETQRLGQDFAREILEGSIAREQPFIQAGQAALPLSQLAALGEGQFRDTPIFRERESTGLAELADAIQGEQISGFARDRFGRGLDVSEEAQSRARLNDLLAIGLGSAGTAGQEGGTLANLATQAALRGGDIRATGAQTAFEQRQNAINQALGELGGLPSFFAATKEPAASTPQFFGASR